MIEDKEKDKSKSTSSNEDTDRVEMKWTDDIEIKITEWSEKCEKIAILHEDASKRKKRLHYGLSFPMIIVPLIMSFSNQFFGDEHIYSNYINSFGYLMVGTLTGLSTFLNYAGKYIQHEVASNRYREVILEIEAILIKKKKYRIPADVSIEHIKSQIECLNKFSISL